MPKVPDGIGGLFEGIIISAFWRPCKVNEKHLFEALKIERSNTEAHNSMRRRYLYPGNLEGAVQAFGEALRLAPKFAWADHNLGLALGKQGKWKEAAAQFRPFRSQANGRSVGIGPP
jgi:Tfp pilus assembly protein PilF